MKIVLFEPEIPQNTGNIARTCSLTGAHLVLVRPFGFSLSHRMLKRAALDYWSENTIEILDDLPSYLENKSSFYFFSSKAKSLYTSVSYPPETILIFGSETKGLPSFFQEKWPNHFVTIPMKPLQRCLNLSNAAAIGLYEALRQNQFVFQ